MKLSYAFLTITLASSIILTGCGGSNNGTSSAGGTNTNQSNTDVSKTNQSNCIQAGVTKMLSIANDLKAQLEAGNEAKVKELGPTLEDTWSSFEDQVKPKFPEQYANIEKYLDPTIAGTKTSPLNKGIVSNMNNQLIQALQDLEQKTK